MNVRFFGGRKSEYVSIPKHNPIGLYFCADTRELFLGDKLLSDGLRVVPTFADLPSISEHKAAEGVIYFVASTKNGYVLPRGGYDWLQVIYAPTSGEGGEIDLSNYYTKAEVDEAILKAITNIEIEVDLSKYATKEEVAVIQQQSARNEVKILAIDSELFDIKEQIANIPTVDLTGYATKDEVAALIPDVDEFATKEALQAVATDVDALAITTAKERYEVIRVPGLEVIHRDDEIRLNTEHVELVPQNVGDGGESNAYYIGIKIYAPDGAERIRQNITSTPGIQKDKEIVPFTATDIDSYGRKYSTIWVKCAVYQNGAWLNYGMNSTSAKCLGYYYSVEWYDNNSNIIENDSIHVVFTNDACHYSAISDAVSRRIIAVEDTIATNITQLTQDIENIENTYVTNETLQNNYVSNTYIVQNYTTTEQLEATYVTNEKVTEVVTSEVNTVVTEQIETKVTEVIQEKVDTGEIEVKTTAIAYGEF